MKKILSSTALFFMLVLSSGCSTKVVNVVDNIHTLSHVCIQNNPKVIVTEFVPVIENVFNDWGISTEVYNGNTLPNDCLVDMKYTALRSWDITPYLSHAEITLYKERQKIGYAEYHLTGGGGFDLSKWASVESKMKPIIEELLASQSKKTMAPSPKATIQKVEVKDNVNEKFTKLKKLYEDALITDAEYDKKRKE